MQLYLFNLGFLWVNETLHNLVNKSKVHACNFGNHNQSMLLVGQRNVESLKLAEILRENARSTHDTPTYIVPNASEGVNRVVATRFPTVESMKRTIRNVHVKHNVSPTSQDSRATLIIPEEYTFKHGGDSFLLHDSGPTDDRILVFSTRRNLSLLKQSNH